MPLAHLGDLGHVDAWTVVTCAEVRLLITMCSAISARMVLIGSMRVRGAVGARQRAEPERRATELRSGGAGARAPERRRRAPALACAMVRAPCADMYASRSCLVMRPPAPVPLHLAQIDVVLARHLAHQRRKRSGESLQRRGSSTGTAAAGAGSERAGAAAGAAAGAGGGGAGAAGCRSGRCGLRDCAVAAAFVDAADHGADADGLAFLHQHLGEHAGGGRRNLGVHFVGRDLEQRLVALDVLAGLLQPLGQRPSTMLSPIWGITTSVMNMSPYSCTVVVRLTQSNSSSRNARPDDSRSLRPRLASRRPAARMEVTGLVSPHGTMYWK